MDLIEEDLANEQVPKQEIKRPCYKCKKDSPYQCPKCKWFYCSLKCYQTHNLNCTEQFYKQNVIEHLKGKKVTAEERKKMQKILETGKDKNDLEFLSDPKHQRFEKLLDLLESEELTLDQLTREELQLFQIFIKDSSNIQNFIKEWEPWWNTEEFAYNFDIQDMDNGKPLEFDDKKDQKLYDFRQSLRERYEKVPALEKLIQREPSPELINHIVQFIFGCTYLCRVYNGDIRNCYDIVIPSLTKIATCLNERVDLPTVKVSLDTTLGNIFSLEGNEAAPFIEIVLKDLSKIFGNKFYLLELCFRFYDVVHKYHESLDNFMENASAEDIKVAKTGKQKISGLKQKLIFYMAFIKGKSQRDLDPVKDEIKAFTQERMKNESLNKEMEKIVRNFNHNISTR